MTNSIMHVLNYFAQFSYPPTIEEVHLYLNKKTNEREFNSHIQTLIKQRKIIKNGNRLSIDKDHFEIFNEREKNSQKLLKKALPLLKHLRHLNCIRFIGISGSLSMHNTSKEGDIDLFVITSNNAVWQTRFFILLYKYSLFLLDRKIASKLCFNLFFSESSLILPNLKHNEYIGHELLQLKPIINKYNSYESLLYKNSWIEEFFPNTIIQKMENNRLSQQSFIGTILEKFLSYIQILWLHKNGYSWEYREQQLWLIQEDFQNIVLYNNSK